MLYSATVRKSLKFDSVWKTTIATVLIFFVWAFVQKLIYGLTSLWTSSFILFGDRLLLIAVVIVVAVTALYKKDEILNIIGGILIGGIVIVAISFGLRFWAVSHPRLPSASELQDMQHRDSVRASDIHTVQNYLGAYYSKYKKYPTATLWEELGPQLKEGGISSGQLPIDPLPEFGYLYIVSADGQKYILAAIFEDPNDPLLKGGEQGTILGIDCGGVNYCKSMK